MHGAIYLHCSTPLERYRSGNLYVQGRNELVDLPYLWTSQAILHVCSCVISTWRVRKGSCVIRCSLILDGQVRSTKYLEALKRADGGSVGGGVGKSYYIKMDLGVLCWNHAKDDETAEISVGQYPRVGILVPHIREDLDNSM